MSAFINVLKIPVALAGQQLSDSGFALAAVADGQLIELAYVRSLVPEFDGDAKGDGNWGRAMAAAKDERCAAVIKKFRERGHVLAGVASGDEFVELKTL